MGFGGGNQIANGSITTPKIADAAVDLTKLGVLTAKGGLLTHNGTNHVQRVVGADGTVLTADSTAVQGVRWTAALGQAVFSKYKQTVTALAQGTTTALSIFDLDYLNDNQAFAKLGVNGKVNKIWCYVGSNSLSVSTTFKLRINGSDATSISIGAGVTGYAEATGLSISIADTDNVNWQAVVGAGSGNISINAAGLSIALSDVT